jgi:hypothetical protein
MAWRWRGSFKANKRRSRLTAESAGHREKKMSLKLSGSEPLVWGRLSSLPIPKWRAEKPAPQISEEYLNKFIPLIECHLKKYLRSGSDIANVFPAICACSAINVSAA